MPGEHASAELLGALSGLLGNVNAAALALDVPGVVDARRVRADIATQLSDYVIPRLVQLDGPLLTVVGGSTGAGKSTLVNSLLGERITESGVLRPTTRSPVLIHHPDDAKWFAPDRILPDLPRTTVPSNDTYALRLATSTKIPRGLAILDAPDVDSIDKGNRELAAQLLAAADLWLFVTSAARYADQVPWDYLRLAAERSTSVAVVLDRTSPDAVTEVRGHLARMMTSRGLSDSPLFTVPESNVDAEGLLPAESVAPIVGWLHDLAGNPDARGKVISHTLDGSIRHIVLRSHDVADAMDAQIEISELLYTGVDEIYRQALESFTTQSTDGTLLRGEVQVRWQEFVGTGDLLRSVEEKVGRIRDRFVDGVTGKRTRSSDIVAAIETGVFNLIVEQAEKAAAAGAQSWAEAPAGKTLLAGSRDLDRASRDFRVKAERTVRDWRQAVLELVRTDGGDKRMTAKFLAFGVNGIGVALMVVMFADAVKDKDSTVALGHKLLSAIFGDDAVKALVTKAHADLDARVAALFDAEMNRFVELVGRPDDLKARQADLRESARLSEGARHADFIRGGEHSA
ncbi:energy-coupling factor transporter ATP-binding protein EcfA2 [Aeromicrobium panaciterrae]|uniref:Energy-coupling factor transporter ATP-binding protein EcfA2 n=1 Tax=Aeromicrobium panaciterrae TaxID=363861 RepID=A0ABU1UMW1_9ACTN|nr:dynamin family protein [Aeromicrobium panaciterrae]MDR7086465.1 energy-coupling factor transporter ATP-binding protein EcfA2 [Aeromicrobium panaciterrae]